MLASITVETWEIAGMSVAVVFAILVLLVLVLQVFTLVAKKTTAQVRTAKEDYTEKKQAKAFEEASELDKAAVATAVYLYFNDAHDNESGVLTIQQNPSAGWHATLNPRL